MNVKKPREQEVIREAFEILEKHLELSKVALLLSLWQSGQDNYLAIREQLFTGETVTGLLEKVKAHKKADNQGDAEQTNSADE